MSKKKFEQTFDGLVILSDSSSPFPCTKKILLQLQKFQPCSQMLSAYLRRVVMGKKGRNGGVADLEKKIAFFGKVELISFSTKATRKLPKEYLEMSQHPWEVPTKSEHT